MSSKIYVTNSNTSTSTILFKAGVSEDILKHIKSKIENSNRTFQAIPNIVSGFGDKPKAWTKEEQEKLSKL